MSTKPDSQQLVALIEGHIFKLINDRMEGPFDNILKVITFCESPHYNVLFDLESKIDCEEDHECDLLRPFKCHHPAYPDDLELICVTLNSNEVKAIFNKESAFNRLSPFDDVVIHAIGTDMSSRLEKIHKALRKLKITMKQKPRKMGG